MKINRNLCSDRHIYLKKDFFTTAFLVSKDLQKRPKRLFRYVSLTSSRLDNKATNMDERWIYYLTILQFTLLGTL